MKTLFISILGLLSFVAISAQDSTQLEIPTTEMFDELQKVLEDGSLQEELQKSMEMLSGSMGEMQSFFDLFLGGAQPLGEAAPNLDELQKSLDGQELDQMMELFNGEAMEQLPQMLQEMEKAFNDSSFLQFFEGLQESLDQLPVPEGEELPKKRKGKTFDL